MLRTFLSALLTVLGYSAYAAQQVIVTATPNSHLGDSAFDAFGKTNANFTENYSQIAALSAQIAAKNGLAPIAGGALLCNSGASIGLPAECLMLPSTLSVPATQLTGTISAARLPANIAAATATTASSVPASGVTGTFTLTQLPTIALTKMATQGPGTVLGLAPNASSSNPIALSRPHIYAADLGVKCDGATDDYAAYAAAIITASSLSRPLVTQNTGSTCLLSNVLTVPTNGVFRTEGNPTFQLTGATHATMFSENGVTNVEIGGPFTIDGHKSIMTDTGHIIDVLGGTNVYIHDITIVNPVNGPTFTSTGGVNTTNSRMRNMSVTGSNNWSYAFAGGYLNFCESCFGTNSAGFTHFVTGTESYLTLLNPSTTNSGLELVGAQPNTSHISIVNPKASVAGYPAWATGTAVTLGQTVVNAFNVYTAGAAGTTGATAPTCTSGTCSDGTITWTYVQAYRSTGDNCISISGSYSSVVGGKLENCWRNGIAFYGDHNAATGVNIVNNGQSDNHGSNAAYYGIDFISNFGGISQYNVATGNNVDDNQTTHTHYAPAAFEIGYAAWATSTVYTGSAYVYNAGNVYVTSVGGTSGATAPTCTSGTCSDGTVTWTWVRSFKVGADTSLNTRASSNVLCGNFFGDSSSGTDFSDTTIGQFNQVCQSSRIQSTNFTLDSTGITFSGSGLQGYKATQTWSSGLAVTYGQLFTNGGRTYRVVNAGGTTSAAPTVTSGTQTTGDGIQWLMVVAATKFPQFTIANQNFQTNGCVSRGASDSLTASILECVGSGSPLSVVAAPVGSVFHRTDGSINSTLYQKQSGTDASGWVPSVSSSTQMMGFSGAGTALAAATTDYCGFAVASCGTSVGTRYFKSPTAGVFSSLYVTTTAPGVGNTYVVSLYASGGTTALTCTVADTNTSCTDTTDTVTIAAGAAYAIQVVTSTSATSLTTLYGGVMFRNP